MKNFTLLTFILLVSAPTLNIIAQEKDTYQTSNGELVIHFLGHGSLLFEFTNMNIYIDPFSKVADYKNLPKANLILVTHSHPDHLDTSAISKINTKRTQMIYTQECTNTRKYSGDAIVMKNGDKQTFEGIGIEAVPAYNINHKRPDGQPFHPKGEGNGYVLTFGDKRIYIGGDTDNIPEMKDLKNIDIAFIPMNLPYTMTPEEMADAAKMVQPKILYPYHFGETDVTKLLELLKDSKEIEVKVRAMK
jgi:L-ascorbate metabolism protein UlaG (beta-lactamase superfamily)